MGHHQLHQVLEPFLAGGFGQLLLDARCRLVAPHRASLPGTPPVGRFVPDPGGMEEVGVGELGLGDVEGILLEQLPAEEGEAVGRVLRGQDLDDRVDLEAAVDRADVGVVERCDGKVAQVGEGLLLEDLEGDQRQVGNVRSRDEPPDHLQAQRQALSRRRRPGLLEAVLVEFGVVSELVRHGQDAHSLVAGIERHRLIPAPGDHHRQVGGKELRGAVAFEVFVHRAPRRDHPFHERGGKRHAGKGVTLAVGGEGELAVTDLDSLETDGFHRHLKTRLQHAVGSGSECRDTIPAWQRRRTTLRGRCPEYAIVANALILQGRTTVPATAFIQTPPASSEAGTTSTSTSPGPATRGTTGHRSRSSTAIAIRRQSIPSGPSGKMPSR